MKRWLSFALLLWASCAHAAVSLVNHASGTTSSLTITSTTSGNLIIIATSSANIPASITLNSGGQTATRYGDCYLQSSIETCWWQVASDLGGHTTVVCGTCGTMNYMAEAEWSGASGIDHMSRCRNAANRCNVNSTGASVLGEPFTPNYAADGVMYAATCASSSGTPTASGITFSATATPNSNAIAWGISSGNGQATMTPTSGCGAMYGTGIGVIQTSAAFTPLGEPNIGDYSAQSTSGAATVTIPVAETGDLITIHTWCLPSCTGTPTFGGTNATCPAGASGASNANAGQNGICYLKATGTGNTTLSYNPTGATNWQVTGLDVSTSASSNISFDTAATSNCSSSCSEGTTVITPSITPTNTGEFLINAVSTLNHASGPHTGSPQWSCYAYLGSSETGDCTEVTTKNILAWIQSSASGSTTANMDITTNNDPNQSVIAAFNFNTSNATIAQPFVIHP